MHFLLKNGTMSSVKEIFRLAFLLGFSLGFFPSFLRASVDPSLSHTNDEALIHNILTDLKNPDSQLWSVFISHGHGNLGELSLESVNFLKEYLNTLSKQNNLLKGKEDIVQLSQTDTLNTQHAKELKQELKSIEKRIRAAQKNNTELSKDCQKFFNKTFNYLPQDAGSLMILTLDISPFEETAKSYSFIIPQKASRILEEKWLCLEQTKKPQTRSQQDAVPDIFRKLFEKLAIQTLNAFSLEFSPEFSAEKEPLVTRYDPNDLWFTIQLPRTFLCADIIEVVDPEAGSKNTLLYFNPHSNNFLIHGCIAYNNFLIKSCTPLLSSFDFSSEIPSQTVTLKNPIPLSHLFLELRQRHGEISYPTQENFLNQFSQQFAHQLTRRFLLAYLNFDFFLVHKEIFSMFNFVYHQEISIPQKSFKDIADILPDYLKRDDPNGYIFSFGACFAFNQLPPPIRSAQELENLSNNPLSLQKFETQDVTQYNLAANKTRNVFEKTKKELSDLENKRHRIKLQLASINSTAPQLLELKQKADDLNKEITENNHYLLYHEEQAQDLFQMTVDIGNNTRKTTSWEKSAAQLLMP